MVRYWLFCSENKGSIEMCIKRIGCWGTSDNPDAYKDLDIRSEDSFVLYCDKHFVGSGEILSGPIMRKKNLHQLRGTRCRACPSIVRVKFEKQFYKPLKDLISGLSFLRDINTNSRNFEKSVAASFRSKPRREIPEKDFKKIINASTTSYECMIEGCTISDMRMIEEHHLRGGGRGPTTLLCANHHRLVTGNYIELQKTENRKFRMKEKW